MSPADNPDTQHNHNLGKIYHLLRCKYQILSVETPGQIPKETHRFLGAKANPKLHPVLVLCSTNNEIFYYG